MMALETNISIGKLSNLDLKSGKEYLEHYGVKGMKWGHKKNTASSTAHKNRSKKIKASISREAREVLSDSAKTAINAHIKKGIFGVGNSRSALKENFTVDRDWTYLNRKGNDLYDAGRKKVVDKFYTKNGEVQTNKIRKHKTLAVTTTALAMSYASNPAVKNLVNSVASKSYKSLARNIAANQGIYNISNGTHRYVPNSTSTITWR